jgi:hypothetical protein
MLQRKVNVIKEETSANFLLHFDGLGGHLKVSIVRDVELGQLQKVNGLGQSVQTVLVQDEFAQFATATETFRQHFESIVGRGEDLQVDKLANARWYAHKRQQIRVDIQLPQAKQLAHGIGQRLETIARQIERAQLVHVTN